MAHGQARPDPCNALHMAPWVAANMAPKGRPSSDERNKQNRHRMVQAIRRVHELGPLPQPRWKSGPILSMPL
jgi:hypothetical protein